MVYYYWSGATNKHSRNNGPPCCVLMSDFRHFCEVFYKKIHYYIDVNLVNKVTETANEVSRDKQPPP